MLSVKQKNIHFEHCCQVFGSYWLWQNLLTVYKDS